MTAALVRALINMERPCVLLAPTGRAAKVMSHYAGVPAFTIHKFIYRGGRMATDGQHLEPLSLNDNRNKDTLFMVDEASMISKELLDDLIRYVYTKTENEQGQLVANGCRLLLVGDDAQLPPVGSTCSLALNVDFMRGYGLEPITHVLTQVARQALESGILANATRVRAHLASSPGSSPFASGPCPSPLASIEATSDVQFMNGYDMVQAIEQSYQEIGLAETLIITRSNKRTNLYNQGIRARILDREEEISTGDRIMVTKNNYFWTQDYDNLPFLANGDTFEILRLRNSREMYGYHFIDAKLQALDYEWEIDTMLWLDTLTTDSPESNYALQQDLYQKIIEDYPEIKNKRDLRDRVLLSPYFNALQIRFSYAVTCHKAQGGQYRRVFIDPGALGQPDCPPQLLQDGMRWLYTALTRATEQVYILQ